MPLRPLGRSGLAVSSLCLGGNVFGWTADEATSHALLDRFVAAGGNFVDTANDALDAVASRLAATPAAVAVAWVIAQPGITSAIASAPSAAQLDELLAATVLHLDAEALAALAQAGAP